MGNKKSTDCQENLIKFVYEEQLIRRQPMQGYSITKALNITEYRITKIISETSQEIHIQLYPHKRKAIICSGCGCAHKGMARGFTKVITEDRRLIDKRVYLHVVKRRRVCPKDGQIHVEAIEWLINLVNISHLRRQLFVV